MKEEQAGQYQLEHDQRDFSRVTDVSIEDGGR
jgi:hypothetical protein